MASTPDQFAVVFEPVPPGSRWQVLLETTQRTVFQVLVDHDDLDVVHDPENIKPLKQAVCSRASHLVTRGRAVVLGETAPSTEVLSWDLDGSTAARRAVEFHSADLAPAAADPEPSDEPADTETRTFRIVDDLDSLAADEVRVLLAGLQVDARPDGSWDPDRAVERVMAFFVRHGFDIVADTSSSASRQHYIETGRFLHKEETAMTSDNRHDDGAAKPDASRPQPSLSSPEPSFPAAVTAVANAIRVAHPAMSYAEAVAHARATKTLDEVTTVDGSDPAVVHLMASYRVVLTLRHTPVAEPGEVYITAGLDHDGLDVFPARVVGVDPYFRREVVDAMCAWMGDWYERTLPYVDEGELELIRWASDRHDVVEIYDAFTEQRTQLIVPVPPGPLQGRYPIGAGRWPWTTVEPLPSRDLPETLEESPSATGDDSDDRDRDGDAT